MKKKNIPTTTTTKKNEEKKMEENEISLLSVCFKWRFRYIRKEPTKHSVRYIYSDKRWYFIIEALCVCDKMFGKLFWKWSEWRFSYKRKKGKVFQRKRKIKSSNAACMRTEQNRIWLVNMNLDFFIYMPVMITETIKNTLIILSHLM